MARFRATGGGTSDTVGRQKTSQVYHELGRGLEPASEYTSILVTDCYTPGP